MALDIRCDLRKRNPVRRPGMDDLRGIECENFRRAWGGNEIAVPAPFLIRAWKISLIAVGRVLRRGVRTQSIWVIIVGSRHLRRVTIAMIRQYRG
ncbi:hypothetical protein NDU88_004695 [Pleurodeles waltl]|uniref:BrnT family toxin n=1 Tax=Pleurodeles waltl TaxID=8319 RepID=A0AAV7TAD1_PLEWA|nr:hypothetical protein NDU88_004695 [Pleurodeles waltl]